MFGNLYNTMKESKNHARAARARCHKSSRKKLENTNPRVQMAKKMHGDHGMSINDICKILK